jgi:hypothetical protein
MRATSSPRVLASTFSKIERELAHAGAAVQEPDQIAAQALGS